MKRTIAIFSGIVLFGLLAGCYGIFHASAQNAQNEQPTRESEWLIWSSSDYAPYSSTSVDYTADNTLTAPGYIFGEVDETWCFDQGSDGYNLGNLYVSGYPQINPSTTVNIVGVGGETATVPITIEQQGVDPTGGCGNPTDTGDNGPGSTLSGGTQAEATFSYTQDTSAYPNGDYTIFASESSSNLADKALVDVNHAVSGGTITVTSEDAINTSTLVNASWDLTGFSSSTAASTSPYSTVVCEAASGNIPWEDSTPCSGTNETYASVSADNVAYTLPDATTTVPGYSLRSIERVPVAEKKDNSLLGSLQLSLKNIFSTVAFAYNIFGSNSGSLSATPSLSLTPQYPSAAFVILWTPTGTTTTTPITTTTTTPIITSTTTITTTTTTSTPPSTAGYDCESNNQCVYVASNAQYGFASSCNTACALSTTTTTTPPLAACTPGVNCPVCNPPLTANPTSIVVPESSSLSYSCSHVTQCQISGAQTGKFSNPTNVPASGSYNVTSSITTTYTLACVNGDYARNANNPMQPESATVTVNGSSYCEQNPNGVGCQ